MNLDDGRKFDGSQTRGWRQSLLVWYDRNRRDLPWRKDRDPYRVWLSEIMLQQTRVAAVIEKYAQFLGLFPTVEHLAAATQASVLAAWRELPGIGRYTSAAIASIAFGEKVAVVDGNVERVAERLLGRRLAAAEVWILAEELLSRQR